MNNDFQEYKKEFLQRLRDDSAINGTDTEDEFINHTLDLLTDYDDLQSPQRVNCGDKTCSNNRKMQRLMLWKIRKGRLSNCGCFAIHKLLYILHQITIKK
jgi:hypothetical protein